MVMIKVESNLKVDPQFATPRLACCTIGPKMSCQHNGTTWFFSNRQTMCHFMIWQQYLQPISLYRIRNLSKINPCAGKRKRQLTFGRICRLLRVLHLSSQMTNIDKSVSDRIIQKIMAS